MPDLTRFSFCPPWHRHLTAEDAAHCTELENAFGPIKKSRNTKPKNLCSFGTCRTPKAKWSAYCAEHRRTIEFASRQVRRYDRARVGQW